MAKVNKPIRLTKANTRKYASTRKSGSTLPKPSSRMKPESKLSTTTYKKILSETEFLKVKKRSMMVNGIDLISIDAAANELRFQCNSVTTPGKKYTVILQFNPLSPDLIVNKRTNLNKLLLDSGIKVYCGCSSFLFWGFQYIAVKKGYAAFGSWKVPYPKIRNPKLRGLSCKHIRSICMALPFWAPSISKFLRKYWSDNMDQVQEVADAISEAAKRIKIDL